MRNMFTIAKGVAREEEAAEAESRRRSGEGRKGGAVNPYRLGEMRRAAI